MMRYELHSHRNGLFLFENDSKYSSDWFSLRTVLDGISDEDLMAAHEAARAKRPNCKSLSDAINALIRARLDASRWQPESAIFAEAEYAKKDETRWRLDFASEQMAVEVAFNHGEAIAWNLLKPVLSAELNHVEKAIQTSGGVLIVVTEAMKKAGNFDGAVGTYEKFKRYLKPMMDKLTVPMVIIGLEPPTTFRIGTKYERRRGEVVRLADVEQLQAQGMLAAENLD